ncbi:MAG: DUF3644 domain-containing protein [Gammaproteobacteria bacterium]|nr:DUF3644 domain-containing protein [Gammaproteobacteria bacterium]
MLESSIDSALLAVEVYNKPRTTFRSEAFISLMIIAWTRLFHAHFNITIGDRYYHKKKNGRYKIIDGEKKSWELATCIRKYGTLDEPTKKNLQFFIKLRNKIEHRHIDKREIDYLIFGECQALLYNYESTLIDLFGSEYSVNEALVYSLQFSQLRTDGQNKSSKTILSRDFKHIMGFVEKYRNDLSDDVFNSLQFSVKLICIPKISNTNRSDAAIEFIKWNELSEEDKKAYEALNVLIKDKRVTIESVNIRRFKPSAVVSSVNENQNAINLTSNLHVVLYKLFHIRPPNGADDPFETDATYCVFDETHRDYVYQQKWIDFLIHFLQVCEFTAVELRVMQRNNESLDVSDYSAEDMASRLG